MDDSKRHKQILINLLDKFIFVCKQNNLKYYLAYGSVLGAVRHKGFIPWDDDIDVYMPRIDYETIQKLPADTWEGCRLASWRTVRNYRYDFLKLEDVNTTVIERIHPDYVGGLFIDIFPLDMVCDNEQERLAQLKRVQKVSDIYKKAYLQNDSDCHNRLELIKLKRLRKKNANAQVLDQWEREVSACQNCKNLIVDYHSPWMHRPMKNRIIGDGIEMEFEGKYYIIPSNYDAYLKHIYGNYMELPPVEQRVGHPFEYLNLDRKISEAEAMNIFDSLHRKYAFNVSWKSEIKQVLRQIGFIR